MKSATQPGVTSAPLVLPTSAQHPFAKLVIRGDLGQIVQQWLILQNKCTIGSASSCAIRCELPGIAAYHALLVIGAKQTFIRALAPKLARDGEPVNELLLTEADYWFEIAGHKFELLRNVKTVQRTPATQPSATRMKFTLARPFELNRPRSAVEAEQSVNPLANSHDLPSAQELNARWIADLIQSAVQPLEHQILNIIEPLNAVKMELAKSKKATGPAKRRRLPKISRQMLNAKTPNVPQHGSAHVPLVVAHPDSLLAPLESPLDTLPAVLPTAAVSQEQTPQPPTEQTELQASDQVQPSTTAEATNTEATNATVVSPVPVANVDQNRALPAAIELLFAKQSASLDILSERLADMNSQIGSLERIVADNIATTKENLPAPTPSNQESIDRLQATTDRLGDLLQELQSRQTESEKSDETWRGEIRQQINDLQAEIRRPIPEPLPAAAPQELPASVASRNTQAASQTTAQVSAQTLAQLAVTSASTAELPRAASVVTTSAPLDAIPSLSTPSDAAPSELESKSVVEIAPSVTAQPSSDAAIAEPVCSPATFPAEFIPQATTSPATAFDVPAPEVRLPQPTAQLPTGGLATQVNSGIVAPLQLAATTVAEPPAEAFTEPVIQPVVLPIVQPLAQPVVQNVAKAIEQPIEQAENTDYESDYNSRFGFSSEPSFSDSINANANPGVPADLANFAPWLQDEVIDSVPSAVASQPLEQPMVQPGWQVKDIAQLAPKEASEPAPHFSAAAEAVHQTPISTPASLIPTFEQPVAYEQLLTAEDTDDTATEPSSAWLTALGVAQTSPTPETNPAPETNQAFASQVTDRAEAALTEARLTSETQHALGNEQLEQPLAAEQPRQIEAASTSLPSWWTEEESSVGTASGVFAGRPVNEPYIPEASLPAEDAIESESVESNLLDPSSDVDDAGEADLAAIYRRFGMQLSDSEPPNAGEVVSTDNLQSPASLLGTSNSFGSAPVEENLAPSQPAEVAPSYRIETDQPIEAEADLPLEEEDSQQLASLFQMFSIGGQATEEQPSSHEDPAEAVAPAKSLGNIAHTNYAPFANDYTEKSFEDVAAESEAEADAADVGASNISAERAQAAMALTPYELPQREEENADLETYEDPIATDNSLESSGSGSSAAGDEEESIEDYMTRLLARMRGGEEVPANPSNSGIRKASTRTESGGVMRPSETSSIMSSAQLKQLPETTRNSQTAMAPFNPEEYVPRALAPEKTKNLAAMRELANTSARSAIQVSARRKYGTALAIKLIIASIGFGVGCTLIMINGLNLNIGLIATVAAYLVALIWGFDAISTIKPILNAGSDKEKAAAAAAAAAGGNAGTGENN